MDDKLIDRFKNYHFWVYVGENKLGFSKVSNMDRGIDVEEFSIGGINDTPYFSASPKKNAGKLIFERGVCGKSELVQKWKAGCQLSEGVLIFVIDGSLQNFFRCYSIDWGMITKWEINQLDSMGSEILINKFEITHDGIVEKIL